MQIPMFALAFCLAWLGGGLLLHDYIELHQKVSYIEAKPRTNSAQKEQQNSDQPRSGIAPVGHRDSEHGRDDKPKWTDIALVTLTFALALATMALYLDAKGKGRLELRAYLGLREHIIRRIGGDVFQVQLHLMNTGKTPAKRVRIGFECAIGNKDGPRGGFPTPILHGSAPLAPGMERSLRKVLKITEEQVARVALPSHEGDIFVWGRIEYDDIYKVPQYLEFRLNTRETIKESIDVGGGRIDVFTMGWALQATEEGNEAS